MSQGMTKDILARSRLLSRTSPGMLLALVVTGFAACGDDGGGPAAPTAPTPPVVQAPSDEDAARESVDAWMALLDAGSYSAAYEATGSFLKEEVTAEEFRISMEEREAILGAVESRTLSSTQRLSTLPDAPPGDYFVFELDGVYELRPNARERVTAVSESGGWPVVGIYLIR